MNSLRIAKRRKQVGGDYFDILNLPDSSTLAVIGDVSGKGISSAFVCGKNADRSSAFRK